jgi:tetratricopeptide (TPR) repeat protein
MSTDNRVAQLLADSKLAFLNQQNEQALKFATEARKIEPNNPDAHKCVANAYMSMGQLEEAVKCYTIAAKYDPANGNRYFDLGYAYAAMEHFGDALKYLAKADK